MARSSRMSRSSPSTTRQMRSLQVYINKVLGIFEQYAKMSHHLAFEGLVSTIQLDEVDQFTDQLAAHLMISTAEKQTLLEILNPYERLQKLHDVLDMELEKFNIDKRINVSVKKQMERRRRSTTSTRRSRPSTRSWGARTIAAMSWPSSKSASRRPGCPRKPARRWSKR